VGFDQYFNPHKGVHKNLEITLLAKLLDLF
jgi:hypothetical protein